MRSDFCCACSSLRQSSTLVLLPLSPHDPPGALGCGCGHVACCGSEVVAVCESCPSTLGLAAPPRPCTRSSGDSVDCGFLLSSTPSKDPAPSPPPHLSIWAEWLLLLLWHLQGWVWGDGRGCGGCSFGHLFRSRAICMRFCNSDSVSCRLQLSRMLSGPAWVPVEWTRW